MATITILHPTLGTTKTITVAMEASIVIQDLLGTLESFVTLSTSAKMVSGDSYTKKTIMGLSDGAGGDQLDRHGNPLPVPAGPGKPKATYATLEDAIDDHVALMVEGTDSVPSTAMAFT